MKLTGIILGSAFLVAPTLTFGQQKQTGPAKPSPLPVLCKLGSLPTEIQNRLKREFGSWKVQEPSALGPLAHERWEAEKPLQCPGIAVGQFENVTVPSYAVLLVPQEAAGAGYRFLIFSPKMGQSSYELKVLAQSDDEEVANLFIHRIRISKVFDKQSRGRFHVQATEGILFAHAGEYEYGIEVYYWANGAFQRAQVDY
jgi:hypothetical protein